MTATEYQPVCKTWATVDGCIAATFRGSPTPDGNPRYYWHVTDTTGAVRDYGRQGRRHHHTAEKDAKRLWPAVS